jgi:poly(3-hydroxyalkanoate) synthetase
VLSTSGHIAAMVNPPGNEKARYQLAEECPEDPKKWLRQAETRHGTWWPDHASWLAERCGDEQAAPAELGGRGMLPICDAPGTYVYDR